MAGRTARCACGRVEVTVEGEPLLVLVCHCDFCQKRSGNVFIVSAHFAEEQVVAISGATTVYNGLEVDGVGAVGNFVDPGFPLPATELNTKDRHHWVVPVSGAVQVHDPLDGSMSLEAMVPSFGRDATTE